MSQPPRPPAVTALAVLRAVARLGFGVTAREICADLHAPPATIYRVLNTLVGEEYLVRTADLRGFGLGRAAAEFIADIAPPVVTTAARSAIDRFRRRVRFGVHVLEFRESSLVVVDEDADHPLRARADLTRALHASAAGKLLLSSRSAERPSAGRLIPLASRTIVDPAVLGRALDEVRRDGYARAVDELEDGLTCIAVPLTGSARGVGGALCLAGVTERADALEELVPEGMEAARAIAPLLY